MKLWMIGSFLSLAGNIGLFAFLFHRKEQESEQKLWLGNKPFQESPDLKALSLELAHSKSRLQVLTSSPLIGTFSWVEDVAAESQSEGDPGASKNPIEVKGIANQAFCKMVGYSTDRGTDAQGYAGQSIELRSNSEITCALPPGLLGEKEFQTLRQIGFLSPFETKFKLSDFNHSHLLVAAQLESRLPLRATLVVVDITPLIETRQELRLSEERSRALSEGSPVGIWNIRTDGKTLYLNPTMASILELDSPLDLIQTETKFQDFFTGESLDVIRMEFIRRSRGIGTHSEVEVVGRWGKRTRMSVYGIPVHGEKGQVESLLGTFVDITERKREEEALRQSEERLRVAAECGNDLIYEWNLSAGTLAWFGPVESRLGIITEDIPHTRHDFENLIHPEDRKRVIASVESHLHSREPFLQEYRILGKDGKSRIWSDRGTAIWDVSGLPEKWIGSATDITESRRAQEVLRAKEEQLRQSQKLEAVGRLAGGIAHDFNNLLAAIMGYCELMLMRLEPNHICRKEVGEILNGSDRAAGLIRQLLAFSRQEIPQPKVIQPSFVIESMERMLRHVLEENINLVLKLEPEVARVRIDPVQLEQVVMNLILNARDAMPTGGTLTVKVDNIKLREELPGAYGKVKPGSYVRVAVTDSGLGIDREHLPHIFDPFYTTKVRGKGNGLGLSTVYGIITQNNGCVLVETEIAKGSVFSFFLPMTLEEPELKIEVQRAMRSSTIMSKTLLVVEDDDEVRHIVSEVLGQQGFLVLEAKHGKEALTLVEEYSLPIHLLLTDVVMPEMGGKDLADALRIMMPSIRVLFMSGYTQDVAFREEVAGGDRAFIQKPFPIGTLISKIREVLS